MSKPRHELKYLLDSHQPEKLDLLIRLHPKQFSQIYYPRVINNLYLDDARLSFYFANLHGVSQRAKVRWRWYSPEYNNFDSSQPPHLEFKVKQSQFITKYVAQVDQINPAVLTKALANLPRSIQKLIKKIKAQSKTQPQAPPGLLAKLELLQPAIVNAYTRRYYLSASGKIRLTVDTDLRFYAVNDGQVIWDQPLQSPATILEFKADVDAWPELTQAANHFPFALNRCSKYVLGVSSLMPDIEQPFYHLPIQPIQIQPMQIQSLETQLQIKPKP